MKIKELIEKIKRNRTKTEIKLIISNLFIILLITGILIFTVNNPGLCKITTPYPDKPILQMIFSPSCPHCQTANTDIFTNLDILSKKYTLNPVYVGNVDTQQLKIIGVPTFILYKNGVEVKRAVGFLNTSALIQELEDK